MLEVVIGGVRVVIEVIMNYLSCVFVFLVFGFIVYEEYDIVSLYVIEGIDGDVELFFVVELMVGLILYVFYIVFFVGLFVYDVLVYKVQRYKVFLFVDGMWSKVFYSRFNDVNGLVFIIGVMGNVSGNIGCKV